MRADLILRLQEKSHETPHKQHVWPGRLLKEAADALIELKRELHMLKGRAATKKAR